MLNYIIAQYASPSHWGDHYDIDPGYTGLHHIHSVHRTPEGIGIKSRYTEEDYQQALLDCENLNRRYPKKGYAVVRSL